MQFLGVFSYYSSVNVTFLNNCPWDFRPDQDVTRSNETAGRHAASGPGCEEYMKYSDISLQMHLTRLRRVV
jgi:hypothetical protein